MAVLQGRPTSPPPLCVVSSGPVHHRAPRLHRDGAPGPREAEIMGRGNFNRMPGGRRTAASNFYLPVAWVVVGDKSTSTVVVVRVLWLARARAQRLRRARVLTTAISHNDIQIQKL